MSRIGAVLLVVGSLIYLLPIMQGHLYSQPPRLELIAPVDPSVSVAIFDPAAHGAFVGSVRSPEWARLIPYSIVLTNESTQHIVGVAVRWIVTNVNGAIRQIVWSLDSFGTSVAVQQPVISGRTQLMATPNGLNGVRSTPGGRGSITASVGAAGQSTFGFGRGQFAQMDEFDEAAHVTAVVDTIIFEDGRVIGPDESHLVDYINGIARAAKTLVKDVRQAAAEGRDVDAFLSNLSASRRTGTAASLRDDPVGSWMMREVEFLLRFSDGRISRLDQLDRLPAPPTFFRK